MSTFIQLHLLTSYPPANLNRDDLGRPKTAVMGGVQRLRVSSQSLKRAWRTSDVFEEALKGHVGVRTKEMGIKIFNQLKDTGVSDKKAKDWAKEIAQEFGKLKEPSEKELEKNPNLDLEIEQLAHFSTEEIQAVEGLAKKLAKEERAPKEDELNLLRKKHKSADIALFGRMLASSPAFNTEAAAQVAHAITAHKTAVEDDYFTAVDDLNDGSEDAGAAHIGETAFAAGLFYQYVCVNWDLLVENLSGDKELAGKALRALAEAAATIAPSGKQNSFASRAYASFALAEKSDRQPRALSVAFLKPVEGSEKQDLLAASIGKLMETRDKMDKVYWGSPTPSYEMNAAEGKGSLKELLEFVSSANGAA
jgi:CRISPR system Cascade subunit CasC